MTNQEIINSFQSRVFFVDDNPNTITLLKTVVAKHLPEVEAHFFAKAQDAIDKMKDGKPTVIVTDWQMPEIDGLELTKIIVGQKKEFFPFHYIIFLTVKDDSNDLAMALEHGAHDYIKKPFNMQELVARVRTGIRTVKLEYDLMRLNEQLEKISTTDSLTEVFNRRHGNIILDHELNKVQRNIQEFSVLMIDLDNFKDINDTYGHNAGDEVLKEVAKRLQQAARSYDYLIRWGGEEFLLVCPCLQKENAIELASRTLHLISGQTIDVTDDKQIQATISIGIATLNRGETITPIELINQADTALYKAKNNGRNQFQFYEGN